MLNLFSTKGRISRKQYFLLSFGLGFAGYIILLLFSLSGFDTLGILLYLVFVILILIQAVKRFHDLGKAGYHAFLLFVPILNIYFVLLLYFQKGIPIPNQYGSEPI